MTSKTDINTLLKSIKDMYITKIVEYSTFDLNSTIIILALINNLKSNKTVIDDFGDSIKDMIINYIDSGTKTDIEPLQFTGGSSDNIWPIFSEIWKNNNKLEFRQKNNPNIIFSVISHNNTKKSTPILGKGTYTAVYEVKKIDTGVEKGNYILRFTRDSTQHFLDENKIKKEYLNFGKYLPKRYSYGYCNFMDKTVIHIADTENYRVDTRRNEYKFEYFVTKKYIPFNWGKNAGKYIGFGLSNEQKFNLLVNIVQLLKSLYEKNIIHTDLKIDNISYDEDLVPIFIDYDKTTLQEVSLSNRELRIYGTNLTYFWFATTYFPNYLKYNVATFSYKNYNIKQQNYLNLKLYSIGGLTEIIRRLQIDFLVNEIIIPTTVYDFSKLTKKLSQNIYLDNPDNFILSLHLEYVNHAQILDYNEILIVLDYIKREGYVKK